MNEGTCADAHVYKRHQFLGGSWIHAHLHISCLLHVRKMELHVCLCRAYVINFKREIRIQQCDKCLKNRPSVFMQAV